MNLDNVEGLNFEQFRSEVLIDYKTACVSRQMSVMARKEVLNGRAKFGIFGDGKEVPQLAMAKHFLPGDWRSGYYRDQTFMLATGMLTPKIFFAQLYGETDAERNPDNGGRSFNNHFGSRLIDDNDHMRNHLSQRNSSSDISPTAGQMPRLLGLALASKIYRHHPQLSGDGFSDRGNEVAWGTIGDASTSEGHFWETMNAAGVLQIPMAVSVWDDGYGISVPTHRQTVHANISKALKGFEKNGRDTSGIVILTAKGWDYPALCQMYEQGIRRCRREHVPVLFHVDELTQPLGHSSSGSHERYKTTERMAWEKERDCIGRMRSWMLDSGLADEALLESIEDEAMHEVRRAMKEAYAEYISPIENERTQLLEIIRCSSCSCEGHKQHLIDNEINKLKTVLTLNRKEILATARRILRHICAGCDRPGGLKSDLKLWVKEYRQRGHQMYSAWLYSESDSSALKVTPVAPVFDEDAPLVPGREIIRDNFDVLLARDSRVLVFGEDVGQLGGVNQTLEGLQQKHGEIRVFDTGIRETSIVGKGIGLALRGLRPIAEIQYFDYLLYALQTMSDDLATLRYRTKNGQQAPLIISTRGHRLEGIWHSGSPMSMVINSVRGMYVCVPRDMTRAAGFYNTLLKGNDPGLVIEPLNGYRLRERRPVNMGDFCIPLGYPEVICEGNDVTVVTYGACVRIAHEAVQALAQVGVSVELIDVQTLLPFDIDKRIVESVRKTGRVVFFDEDVPGGATAYMMQQVVEEQGGFYHLDANPVTVTARQHRPAYGTDGDYFSNPSAEDVYEAVYALMAESDPKRFPPIYD